MSQRSLTKAEHDEIRHAFHLFDTENTGRIAIKDIKEALEDTNGSSSDRAKLLMNAIRNLGNDKTLTIDEFTELFRKPNEGDDDMKRIFRLFDTDQKGYIEVKDLQRITKELGEHSMTDMELQEMIDRASLNTNNGNNGRVTLEDFSAVMNKKLWTS
mmetsp:Transcript_25974/g.29719  ORF Transcript_25974/g.29719 Transcript_25974/m.29719 type:complete len:157 (+) Transcript_25974:184-654(+)|eukprot:CAMPEP_0194171530 /NCGR_PEP_ID=MMETSP0154-20130528/6095_1 /TAXON_ID=1049557 /ORGANISM="Thalassiothrix antarctica, Strain L6-D1" /LENGTH=156 /DNA_ID=CAMNT_0038883859 /DNA_START=128 /DNA_END=598 /DNA_ORIENTATION=-